MGLFSFFKKKKEKVEEKKVEEIQEAVTEEKPKGMCSYCGKPILHYEKRAKVGKQTLHRRCRKKLKKEAKKEVFG